MGAEEPVPRAESLYPTIIHFSGKPHRNSSVVAKERCVCFIMIPYLLRLQSLEYYQGSVFQLKDTLLGPCGLVPTAEWYSRRASVESN
jgi:hypothetical protein